MKKIVLGLVVCVTLACVHVAGIHAAHKNVLKEKQDSQLANNPIDMWVGKPLKPYSVIDEIVPSKYETLRKGSGSLGIANALYYLRVEAMRLGANAVINVRCQNWIGERPAGDNGDFYDKANYLVDLTSNIICTGEAVKYK